MNEEENKKFEKDLQKQLHGKTIRDIKILLEEDNSICGISIKCTDGDIEVKHPSEYYRIIVQPPHPNTTNKLTINYGTPDLVKNEKENT